MLFILVGAALTGAVIVGQDLVDSRSDRVGGDYPSRPIGNNLVVYIDPITRCEYLRPSGSSAGLTSRTASDGLRQAGCGARRQQSLSEIEQELTRRGR